SRARCRAADGAEPDRLEPASALRARQRAEPLRDRRLPAARLLAGDDRDRGRGADPRAGRVFGVAAQLRTAHAADDAAERGAGRAAAEHAVRPPPDAVERGPDRDAALAVGPPRAAARSIKR